MITVPYVFILLLRLAMHWNPLLHVLQTAKVLILPCRLRRVLGEL